MSKFVKPFLIILGLIIIAAISFPFVGYLLQQPQQRQGQIKFLNGSFGKIQPQNGKVLFTPGRYFSLRTPDNDFFDKPMLLAVGSQFSASDEHWGATYIITNIDPDGVIISFDADGYSPSSVRKSSGSVKLAWK